MRVFITGSTGVIGHRLVATLAAGGHDPVGLVRDDAGAATVRAAGGLPVRGDVLDEPTLRAAMPDTVDAAVHAATKLPTDPRPSDTEWEHNDRVRREGARNLVAAATDAGVEQVLFPSVVWLARQPDGSAFDATDDRYPTRTTRSAAAVEDLLAEASESHGFDATILRLGYLYAHDSAHLRQFADRLRDGDLPIVGRGLLGRRDARLSLLHAADAATAFTVAVETGLAGTYHVVDDEPVTLAAFLRTLAERLDAPEPGRVPAWLARWAVGADAVRLLSRPMPTTAARFRDATGWAPQYPTYRHGLDQAIAEWGQRQSGPFARH